MDLRNLSGARDAAVVASWPASAQECRRWCARDQVSARVVAGWSDTPDVVAYRAVVDGALVGYGELWLDDEEAEVELARLIVAPSCRGQGIGRRLVTALTAEALARHSAVFVRVWPDNLPALRCYAGAAFVPVPADDADEWNRAQPVPYVWLRYAPQAGPQ
ncbi:GNAT family N-acetyltransferase [Micromonospora sp. NPDC051300]|uniref:GNAT family N-acetyltransferase n=1 Tax=Micromonospora sp. NPDC051300 TaxID=3364286 RepID=UPI0037B50700